MSQDTENTTTDGAGPVDRRVGRWPLGINPAMDEHAANCGLAHWSATSATKNVWWIRRDGRPHCAEFNRPGGYPDELRAIDANEPPEQWVFAPNAGGEPETTARANL